MAKVESMPVTHIENGSNGGENPTDIICEYFVMTPEILSQQYLCVRQFGGGNHVCQYYSAQLGDKKGSIWGGGIPLLGSRTDLKSQTMKGNSLTAQNQQ